MCTARRLLLLVALAFCASRAHAGVCATLSGAVSQTTFSTALASCGSGNTLAVASGAIVTLTSSLSVPCGVSIMGSAVALATYTGGDGYKRMGYAPAAVINSTATPAFSYGTCSTARSFEYLEVAGNRPATGGQAIYATSSGGVSDLTISFNYFHGNNWNGAGGYGSGPQNAALVLFDGSAGAAADLNDTVSWNRFGASGDCATVITNTSYAGYSGDGGFCNGIGFHTNMTNFNASNNVTYSQEQGFKGFEGSWVCSNCVFQANDFSNIHRINIETQILGTGTSMLYAYNSTHDPVVPSNGTFGISTANGCGNTNPSTGNCITQDLGNVIIENLAPVGSHAGDGIEYWSANTASYANYNLVQGQWANSMEIATDGAATFTGNLVESSYGAGGSNTPSNCFPGYAGAFGWWATEDSPANTPTNGGGNVCHFYDGSVQTSALPSVSPAGTTVTSGTVITIGTTGTNRDLNTSEWCTIDGTTPVPGSGTATIMTSYTVTSSKTLKCLGMWGAANQPFTYPTGPELSGTGATGYGYTTSSVVTNTYTVGGTLAAPSGVQVIMISENEEMGGLDIWR